jgi:hypothetical protein
VSERVREREREREKERKRERERERGLDRERERSYLLSTFPPLSAKYRDINQGQGCPIEQGQFYFPH